MSQPNAEPRRGITLPVLLGSALVSAVLHVCALPPLDLGGLAFVALVPLLVALRLEPRAIRAAAAGLVFGVVSVVGVVHWVPGALVAGNGFAAAAAWLLSVLVFGWYALWFTGLPWLLVRLDRSFLPDALSPPLAWVTIETLRDVVVPGLAWTLYGHSQHAMLPILQLAEFGGAPGLSFLLVLANALVADGIVAALRRQSVRRITTPLCVGATLVVAMFAFGALRLAVEDRERAAGLDAGFAAAAVQIAIPQSERWKPEFAWARIDALLESSRLAVRAGASLVAWPETAIELHLDALDDLDAALARSFPDPAAASGRWLLAGAPRKVADDGEPRFYNSAALIDPAGGVIEVYDKRVLYPVSEYVPDWVLAIPGASRVLASQLRWAPYSPGRGERLLLDAAVPIGVMICFEGTRQDAGRQRVRDGAQLLVQLANDAVIPNAAAAAQHFAIARFRAVENRRDLIRASNFGVNAIVAASGRVMSRVGAERPGIAMARVVPAQGSTPFVLLGWIGPWGCVGVTLLVAMIPRREGVLRGRP